MDRPLEEENIEDINDNDLIVLIVQEGRRELMHVIYDRYADKVYHKCISLCKDRILSQDLMHDIMVKILAKLSQFKGTSDFSFWVHSITYNYCMDHLRKKKKSHVTEVLDYNTFDTIAEDEIEQENNILKELRLEQLAKIFENLDPEEKGMLLMRYQESLSIKEIAEVLGISDSAVKMRLKRSRDRLAELLNSEQ
jgi:RNA polymerase sigma-70 factor (ECF subfamily)